MTFCLPPTHSNRKCMAYPPQNINLRRQATYDLWSDSPVPNCSQFGGSTDTSINWAITSYKFHKLYMQCWDHASQIFLPPQLALSKHYNVCVISTSFNVSQKYRWQPYFTLHLQHIHCFFSIIAMLVLHEQPQNQISGNSTHQHTHRGVIPDVNWLPLLECSQMLPMSWSAPRCCHCPGALPHAATVLECSQMLPLSWSAPRCCHCPGVLPNAATVLVWHINF